MAGLPDVLEHPPITLRRATPDAIGPLERAVTSSYLELRQWMVWAQSPPSEADLATFLAEADANFAADVAYEYLCYEGDDPEVVGGAGLRRIEGAFEIGYWVRSDRTGRGFASAAARALTDVAFSSLDARRIEIHMDIANSASRAVAERLGYRRDREEDHLEKALGNSGRGYVYVTQR